MESQEEKYCPLLSGSRGGPELCRGEYCAWCTRPRAAQLRGDGYCQQSANYRRKIALFSKKAALPDVPNTETIIHQMGGRCNARGQTTGQPHK